MCGITGFFTLSGHDTERARQRIKRMADTLYHRGPDEEGYYVDDAVALGHRRLSIIDLTSGQQPMSAMEQRFQIVFNGEIYNFKEIRKELIAAGYSFTTNSDTEVILLAYLKWGPASVEKLNGMFAYAIWDKQKRLLFIARDRVGKKPLYYYWDGNFFSFASELKALRTETDRTREINYQALDCYYSFGYIPSPFSIYQDIAKLEPAHYLTIDQKGLVKKRYWLLKFSPKTNLTLETAAGEFEALLDEATKCRLMSEVPLGAFLSGGLDSTLVVSSMSKMTNSPVLTNSIGFGEGRFNELPLARLVSEHLKTCHAEFTLQPKAADILPRLACHFDEPFADSSAIPTWYVCQMARKNVTVALSGDGGDESFGGYTFRYLPHMFESNLRRKIPTAFRGMCFSALGAVWPGSARLPKWLRLRTIFENLARSDGRAFYEDLIWLRSDVREKLYTRSFIDVLKGFTPYEMVEPFYNHIEVDRATQTGAEEALQRAQYTDVNFYMTEDVLVKVDRMSMAHSLEVRSPMLDYRILEFAATLPAHLKLDKRKGKLVPRELAQKRLPPSILNQPKTGFSIPVADWLRNELNPQLKEAVTGDSDIIKETLDQEILLQMCREHEAGKRDHSVFLWGVLMLHMWEKYVH